MWVQHIVVSGGESLGHGELLAVGKDLTRLSGRRLVVVFHIRHFVAGNVSRLLAESGAFGVAGRARLLNVFGGNLIIFEVQGPDQRHFLKHFRVDGRLHFLQEELFCFLKRRQEMNSIFLFCHLSIYLDTNFFSFSIYIRVEGDSQAWLLTEVVYKVDFGAGLVARVHPLGRLVMSKGVTRITPVW